jgi:ArsR family transcriptional regulator, virulence genes transcriptional regulator
MQTEATLQLNDVVLRQGKSVLRAIDHSLRQEMLALIHKNERMIVTDLYESLKIEQSVASQHLAILRKANIVNTERAGKKIFYSVNYQRIKEIHVFSEKITNRDLFAL